MDPERARRKAELLEAEDKQRRVLLEADALLTDLRQHLDPLLVDDVLDLDLDRSAAVFAALLAAWRRGREAANRIEKLRRALGLE